MKKKELFEVAEHLVYQRLEYSDYYQDELFEQYDYTEEEMEFILDNIYSLLKGVYISAPEIPYEDYE